MVLISKDEAFMLREKGIKGIFNTHTKHKKYYLVESRNNIEELIYLRKSMEGETNSGK